MRFLITGGAGFIGSHLAEALIKKGHEIIIIDNFSRGKLENISHLIDNVKLLKNDILDFDSLDELISNVDIVFHLAAISRVMPSIKHPELCFRNNVEATEIISRLCAKYKKKLIFSSSREIYGTAKYIPVDEKHSSSPENPYGVSKICGEKLIKGYSICYDLKYSILRLGNVYGLRDFDRVIPIFMENALQNNDMKVYGGEQVLDFVYINDVVEAFLKIIGIKENIIVNIGSGQGTKIIDLANTIKNITNSNCKIINENKRRGEVEIFISNIDHSKKILGWKPKTTLENGIKNLIRL